MYTTMPAAGSSSVPLTQLPGQSDYRSDQSAMTAADQPQQPLGQQNPPVPGQAPPLTMQAAVLSASQAAVTSDIDANIPAAPVAESPMEPAPIADPSAEAGALREVPDEAADIDVIEKEWVDKAKQVIAETRTDPYKQVRALHALRADYMKKRYNKDIKLPDA